MLLAVKRAAESRWYAVGSELRSPHRIALQCLPPAPRLQFADARDYGYTAHVKTISKGKLKAQILECFRQVEVVG